MASGQPEQQQKHLINEGDQLKEAREADSPTDSSKPGSKASSALETGSTLEQSPILSNASELFLSFKDNLNSKGMEHDHDEKRLSEEIMWSLIEEEGKKMIKSVSKEVFVKANIPRLLHMLKTTTEAELLKLKEALYSKRMYDVGILVKEAICFNYDNHHGLLNDGETLKLAAERLAKKTPRVARKAPTPLLRRTLVASARRASNSSS